MNTSYFIYKNKKQYEPYSAEDLKSMLHTGSVSSDDNVWYEGVEDWKPLKQDPIWQVISLSLKNEESVQIEHTSIETLDSSLQKPILPKKKEYTNLIWLVAFLIIGCIGVYTWHTVNKPKIAPLITDSEEKKRTLLDLKEGLGLPSGKSTAEKEFWSFVAEFRKAPPNATPLVKKMHALQGIVPQAIPSSVPINKAPISAELVIKHQDDFLKRHPWAVTALEIEATSRYDSFRFMEGIMGKDEYYEEVLRECVLEKDYLSWTYLYIKICLFYDYLNIHGTEKEKQAALKKSP